MDDFVVVRSFDSLEAAAAAVNQLVGAGFEHGALELRVLETESGPGEGNFVIGNGVTTHGGRPKAVLAGPEVPYEENFKQPVSRSLHLVMVDAHSEAEQAKADQVLDASGGRAVQDIADAAMQRA
ncbi:MAG TPA: hypothetical protein VHL79_15975 [Ramlibacter sp.]|jgi:hypothetical protein|nr:hypothetical protein [Ramlibacter sp.]